MTRIRPIDPVSRASPVPSRYVPPVRLGQGDFERDPMADDEPEELGSCLLPVAVMVAMIVVVWVLLRKGN